MTSQPEESCEVTKITAEKSADITTADLSSAGQQTAPPTSTSGFNNPIQSDSTEEEDHLKKQFLKNGSFSLLPLVHTTVIRTADCLGALVKEQENFKKKRKDHQRHLLKEV